MHLITTVRYENKISLITDKYMNDIHN